MKGAAFLGPLVLLPLFSDAAAQVPPLLREPAAAALAGELSGEAAKRHLEFLARLHRMRGSRQFRQAAEFIAGKLREYGLEQVEILQFPADGKTIFGTQKSRPAWDAEFAELWELGESGRERQKHVRLASFEAMPVTLAQDSESADIIADLVDVGSGVSESDYAGRDVRGKIVLVGQQPGAVAALAVKKHGAAGIVSYAPNQRTAWWKENEDLVRWGHLDSFADFDTFAFMISLKQARALQERLIRGERIGLHAVVKAGRHPGFYDVVTAVITGADPRLRNQEIAFSCHLDHQKPGANDNASGCATILEGARTLAKLIREGRLVRPARTLRFIWPPEIEGTTILLNARPDLAERIKAVVHMDMVGGGPDTKAVLHVTRSPRSLPSFINDVAEAFAEFVNDQSDRHAGGEQVPYAMVSPEGGKEALQAQVAEFSMGSDHEVFTDGSFGIPAIYLNDWPDRYIHTNLDAPDKVDPTKMKRAGFIGAASAYFLAGMQAEQAPEVWELLRRHALRRAATLLARASSLPAGEAANLRQKHFLFERRLLDSIEGFASVSGPLRSQADAFYRGLEAVTGGTDYVVPFEEQGGLVFRRSGPRGPLSVFGYDYLNDRYGAERARGLGLLRHQGLRGGGGEYAYEVLNFVDGRRTAQEIRDAVSAEYGPVPLLLVVEFLRALESIGVVSQVR